MTMIGGISSATGAVNSASQSPRQDGAQSVQLFALFQAMRAQAMAEPEDAPVAAASQPPARSSDLSRVAE
jgi:hypothetical protein